MTRVGIIGLGFMGMVHYLTYRKLPGVEVVAIADRHPERLAGDWRAIQGNFGPPGEQMDLAGIATYATPEQLIAEAEVDLVDICLPPATHAENAIAALGRGKHVFCEKPMALNLSDCDRMLAAADSAGKQLLIGHVLPYFPEYAWALDEINSGKHGKLLGASLKRVISDPTWLTHYWDADRIGGPMLDLHVHDAHFIRAVFGMPTDLVTRGTTRNQLPEHWHTLMSFADPPLKVHATSGVIAQQGRPFLHGFEIQLEKATLLFEFAVLGDKAEYLCPPTLLTEAGKTQSPDLGDGDPMHAFERELSHVVEVIAGGAEPGYLSGQFARDAVELCQQQTNSLHSFRSDS